MPTQLVFAVAACLLLTLTAAACGGDDEPDHRWAQPSRHVLSEWLGVDESTLRFEAVEEVTWPNGCMGVEWPGRVCSQALVSGYRLTFRSENDQPHYVHVTDDGEFVWAPIWETETEIVSINGRQIQFTPTRGGFSALATLTNGTTVEGTPRLGAKVYAAESSAPTDDGAAPLVILVVLD